MRRERALGPVARWLMLLAVLALRCMAMGAASAVTTTTIADTVYHADGTPATGLVLITWPAFTTAGGQTVSGGSTSAAVATGGAMQVNLAPNVGATPAGSYYTAVYHLDDGSVSREYWLVPASAVPVTISSVRSTVLPAAVAVQTVTKSYVDTAIAAAVVGGATPGTIPFVTKTGDTMAGPLTLAGDPTATTQAATKHYVDTSVAALASGLTQLISTAPAGTQAVVQPAGTQLVTNRMNGTLYASQYVSGQGNNGIANAAASADCAGGCEIKAEPTYNSPEQFNISPWKSSLTSGTHLVDSRGAQRSDIFLNPLNQTVKGDDYGQMVEVFSSRSAASVSQATGSEGPSSEALLINHVALAGGSNLFPASIESHPPYFKSNYLAESVNGTYYTLGQHVLSSHFISCYGVGDCLAGSQFVTASGGFRDEADEATHPFDLQIQEDTKVFQGTCATGCTGGSTQVMVHVTANAGTQGEGRFLMDTKPSLAISNGTLTGGAIAAAGSAGPTATFAGTSFPVSVFLQTTNQALSQARNIAPGTVAMTILSSGVPSGFATTTAALPNGSGVACVVDQQNGFNPTNYEMATYTVTDATHLQMTLNKVHAAGATIAVGGLCGYGLEQTVDTSGGIRQVFPVIGSTSATSLFYAGHLTALVGQTKQSSGYFNVSLPITSVSRAGGITTATTSTGFPADLNGLTLTVAGVSDASYDGSFVVTTTGANTLTYANGGSDGASGGGTIGMVTGGYGLYPMAEVLSVLDQSNQAVDGLMTLAPNTVQWAANDPVEEPHYFQEKVSPDQEFIGQTVPRPTVIGRAGLVYERNLGPGMRGWTIQNTVPASAYFGNGGTHWAPDDAYEAVGVWNRTMEAQAGELAAFWMHCNSHGCGKWNSGYDLFELDSSAGLDTMNYQPQTSAFAMTFRGTTFGFGPGGFSAGVVNAGTVNATTLAGSLDAANVRSGTLSAARLPVFGASGASHAAGAVPDPGAAAGTARFLREDGLWTTPAGGGAGGGGGGASGTAAITGGAIDGATIGATTAGTGRFSQLAVTGCNWSVAGTDQGVGTCSPTSWNGVANVDGSNLQIFNDGASRLIVASNGIYGSLAEFHFVNMGAPANSRNWRMSNNTQGVYTLDMNTDNYSQSTIAMQCQPGGSCQFPNGITAANFAGVLAGTTGVIGGAPLAAGACVSGTVAVSGATVGAPVTVSANDGTLPMGTMMLNAAVGSTGQVTVQVCAVVAGTPSAKTYNVRVLE